MFKFYVYVLIKKDITFSTSGFKVGKSASEPKLQKWPTPALSSFIFICFWASIQVTSDGWILVYHLLIMRPTGPLSLPPMLGRVQTLRSLDRLRCSPSKHTKRIFRISSPFVDRGVVVRTTFPIKTEPQPNTQLQCWNMALCADQPTTGHVCPFQCPSSALLLNQTTVILYLFKNHVLVVKVCEEYSCWSQKAVFYYFWVWECFMPAPKRTHASQGKHANGIYCFYSVLVLEETGRSLQTW